MRELIQQFKDIKQQTIDSIAEAINAKFRELFEKVPELESVSWTQYTPYFNDGDICEFSCHLYDAKLNDTDSWDFYDHNTRQRIPSIHDNKIVKEYLQELREIPEEFFKDIYGDHSEITFKRDEPCAIITDCEHD